MKKPKLSVAASSTKKPKTTFSRFTVRPRGRADCDAGDEAGAGATGWHARPATARRRSPGPAARRTALPGQGPGEIDLMGPGPDPATRTRSISPRRDGLSRRPPAAPRPGRA